PRPDRPGARPGAAPGHGGEREALEARRRKRVGMLHRVRRGRGHLGRAAARPPAGRGRHVRRNGADERRADGRPRRRSDPRHREPGSAPVSTEHDDFLPIFLDEAFGRIDTMLDLLAAEEAGTAETVTVLLREAHTLKGAAGIVGLGEVQQIAHAMEEVLAAARETGAGLDPASTAVVKRQVDALRRRLDEAAAAKTDGA